MSLWTSLFPVTTAPRWTRSSAFDTPLLAPANQADMRVQVVRDPAAFAAHLLAWEELAAHALEPNVFYEPWMLLPAVATLRADADLLFVLVYGRHPSRPQGPPLLCGLFPLERLRSWRGLPLSLLSLWRHRHCYLGTPLVHAAYARPALAAFLDWLHADPEGASLFELGTVPADGPFYALATDLLRERGLRAFLSDGYARALFRPAATADAYLRQVVTGKTRWRLQRHEKRLAALGRLDYVALERQEDLAGWLDEFLRLEASGWKGRAGSALACSPDDRRFFQSMMCEAFRRGRLQLMSLRLNGRPVALACNLCAGDGAFAFKSCYDEACADNSPGALLKIAIIRELHQRPGLRWVDSCTTPANEQLNRLWNQRRPIHTLLFAPGNPWGRLLLTLFPTCRRLRQAWVKQPRQPARLAGAALPS